VRFQTPVNRSPVGAALRRGSTPARRPTPVRTYAETAAWAKVLVDKPTDRITGAHILGHASEELIHVFALAMKHGITAGEIKELVYGFPTFSADIKSMF
jgi:pyruvate/2-oxoglutarate dehydrogenase complex dihydrolipoamide dehydrogenase (E3) component